MYRSHLRGALSEGHWRVTAKGRGTVTSETLELPVRPAVQWQGSLPSPGHQSDAIRAIRAAKV